MKKKALILDLDNTIYPVSSISGNLFAQLFKLIDENPDGLDLDLLQKARLDITRRPFHVVADDFNLYPYLPLKEMAM